MLVKVGNRATFVTVIIGSKAKADTLLNPLLAVYKQQGLEAFAEGFEKTILKDKMRFPVLEHVGRILYQAIPASKHVELLDGIIARKQLGGYVLAGIILQLRLKNDFKRSITKALKYIVAGNEWYVCDIIGERVLGFAMLTYPEKTKPLLEAFAHNENKWVVRSVGVATHYAVKKGLPKNHANELFLLLLKCSGTTDFHTKKGIGWAAKTIAKFHPDIIKFNTDLIEKPEVKQWFKTKVKIGLSRSFKYASKH